MFKGSDWKEEFDELIRDITRVGFIAKSEARRRIELIVSEAYQQGKEEERERTSSEMSKIHPVIHSDSNCALCAIRNFLKSSTV